MDVRANTAAVGVSSTTPRGSIDSYFAITERGSTPATEILAGVSTFLALSYIFVVNPAILGQAGIPVSMSLFATITISALATILMGVWAKLPFAVSTGLEITATSPSWSSARWASPGSRRWAWSSGPAS